MIKYVKFHNIQYYNHPIIWLVSDDEKSALMVACTKNQRSKPSLFYLDRFHSRMTRKHGEKLNTLISHIESVKITYHKATQINQNTHFSEKPIFENGSFILSNFDQLIKDANFIPVDVIRDVDFTLNPKIDFISINNRVSPEETATTIMTQTTPNQTRIPFPDPGYSYKQLHSFKQDIATPVTTNQSSSSSPIITTTQISHTATNTNRDILLTNPCSLENLQAYLRNHNYDQTQTLREVSLKITGFGGLWIPITTTIARYFPAQQPLENLSLTISTMIHHISTLDMPLEEKSELTHSLTSNRNTWLRLDLTTLFKLYKPQEITIRIQSGIQRISHQPIPIQIQSTTPAPRPPVVNKSPVMPTDYLDNNLKSYYADEINDIYMPSFIDDLKFEENELIVFLNYLQKDEQTPSNIKEKFLLHRYEQSVDTFINKLDSSYLSTNTPNYEDKKNLLDNLNSHANFLGNPRHFNNAIEKLISHKVNNEGIQHFFKEILKPIHSASCSIDKLKAYARGIHDKRATDIQTNATSMALKAFVCDILNDKIKQIEKVIQKKTREEFERDIQEKVQETHRQIMGANGSIEEITKFSEQQMAQGRDIALLRKEFQEQTTIIKDQLNAIQSQMNRFEQMIQVIAGFAGTTNTTQCYSTQNTYSPWQENTNANEYFISKPTKFIHGEQENYSLYQGISEEEAVKLALEASSHSDTEELRDCDTIFMPSNNAHKRKIEDDSFSTTISNNPALARNGAIFRNDAKKSKPTEEINKPIDSINPLAKSLR